MKIFDKLTIAAFFFVFSFFVPALTFAAGPAIVNLGSASNYVILSKTAITTTGVTSIIGNIGISPASASALTGFGQTLDSSGQFSTSALVSGKIYASDYAVPTPATMSTAISDMQSAYVDAAGRTPGVGANLNVGGGTLNGQTFVPGTYTWGSNVDITGNITLSGTASDVWIFQISGTLSLEAGKNIILAGGALPQNIFWQVAGTTTVYPGAIFSGVILAGPGASTIAFQNGAVLNGQALGQTDVTLIGTTVSSVLLIPPVAAAASQNGGDYTAIIPIIGITKIPTPLALSGPGSVTYNYTIWNAGNKVVFEPTLPLTNITLTDDKCSPVTYVSGDTNNNKELDPGETWNYTCTTTLSTTTTNTATVTGYSEDTYHPAVAAIATAISTVVVGIPAAAPVASVAAPLINVIEVPNRLTPFPFGGGSVTYTYTVTNPGVVAIHDVALTDNKCAPVSRVSGDTNSNNLLDPNETWIYTCTTNVPVSTASVATVKGDANGFPALGYAYANVLVATPGLPNTGFPANSNISWTVIILAALLVIVSVSLIVTLKKRKI